MREKRPKSVLAGNSNEVCISNWIALNFKIVDIPAARLRSDDHDQYHFLRFEDQPWPLREKISRIKASERLAQWWLLSMTNGEKNECSVSKTEWVQQGPAGIQ